MIKEDHVSFEIAKLLKEKGFNEICRAAYTVSGKFITFHNYYSQCKDECIAPTHQMAMKWLREVHNIYIGIFPTHNIFSDSIDYEWQTYNASYDVTGDSDAFFNIYEDAVEDVIKYCLENLI